MLRNEANVVMYYYLIPFRLSTDPKYMTLGDSEWLECYTLQYCDLPSSNFLLTYLL